MVLNMDMHNNDLRTFTATNYGVDLDELSTDAENVIRRAFEAGEAPALDLYLEITGRISIRFAS